ncbi:hypothetical protein GCM10009624_20850 [Gordonia sinesedis]
MRRRLARIPWSPAGVPAIRAALMQAHLALAGEWRGYLPQLERRMDNLAAALDDLESGGRYGGADYDATVADLDDLVDLYRLTRSSLRLSLTAAEVTSTVTPIWVPDAVTSLAADRAAASVSAPLPSPAPQASPPSAAALGIDALRALGDDGLLLFAQPLARFRETLPEVLQPMPEVAVDGVLWWTSRPCSDPDHGHADDVPAAIGLRPLTRSRDLPLRGPGWDLSVLTEITNFDVLAGAEPALHTPEGNLVARLAELGNALQDSVIRLVDAEPGATHSDGSMAKVTVLDAA